jgi:hypothetical protein
VPRPNCRSEPHRSGACRLRRSRARFHLRENTPSPGKENDGHNPQRIAPRNLFDTSVGHDNLSHGDRYKWSLRFAVINLSNKTALYYFFSTFSGARYVTLPTETVELGFMFWCELTPSYRQPCWLKQ